MSKCAASRRRTPMSSISYGNVESRIPHHRSKFTFRCAGPEACSERFGMDPRTTRAPCIGFRDRYLRCRSSSTSICHFSIGPVDSFGRRVKGRSRLSSRQFCSGWESSATAGSRQCGNSVAGSRQPSADPMCWRPSLHAGARPGSRAATPLPWPFDSRPLGHRANPTDGWSARIASSGKTAFVR